MTQPSKQLWWLNPAWVAGLMGAVVTSAAYLIPESGYQTFWRTPKFFGLEPFLLSIAFTLVFALGAVVAMSSRKRKAAETNWQQNIPWTLVTRVFWISVIGSIVGYIVWAAVAVSRGATLALALGVLRGEKGASNLMKDVYLGTISGVTTLTQLGLVAVVLGVMIGVARGWKEVRWALALLFGLAVLRAMFNSERLAIIELAIPAIVLTLRLVVFESPRFKGRLRTILQFVPVAGGAVLLVLFGVFEYFRSWSSYYAGGDMSFWEFVSLRLLGYYVTALNNGALMISRIEPIAAPFLTFHFLWRFPVFSSIMEAIYPNLKVASLYVDPFMEILDREANPEFNNPSALLPPVVDYGVIGALLFWLLAGMLCGLLYRWFRDCEIPGLLFYPIFFTGVVETTRIPYWGEGRVVTAFLVLIPLSWLCTVWAQRTNRVERRLQWLHQQSH